MKITVYVPCHNNALTIGDVLTSLRSQTRPADQCLFIDDHCSDESPEIARQHDFQVLQLQEKTGLAAGRNCALNRAEGEILQGFDGDVAAEKNYLEELEKHFEAMPQIAAIGGRMEERFTDSPADLWRSIHMAQHWGPKDHINPPYLFGATVGSRVSELKAVGGWDERFRSAFEDVEISNRLKTVGSRLLYTPACRAWHLKRDTPDSVLRTFWNWNYFGYEEHLSNPTKWSERLAAAWGRYRQYRVEDQQHPSLRMLTLKMAWAWTIRDLYALRKSAPKVGHIPDIIKIAETVVTRLGMNPEATVSLVAWLKALVATLEEPGAAALPLNHEIARKVCAAALESISDDNYWQQFPD